MSHRRSLLLAGLAVASLAVASFASVHPARAEVAKEFVIGSPDAPVTMIEYASLTCPHCADFENNTLPDLKKKYIDPGKVKLIYRDFPLDKLALEASKLAHCAGQERGPTFLSAFFGSQERWATASDPSAALRQLAKLGGLSDDRIDACLADKELEDSILKMRLDAEKEHSVQSTPTFIINDQTYAGNQGMDRFAEILDPLVN